MELSIILISAISLAYITALGIRAANSSRSMGLMAIRPPEYLCRAIAQKSLKTAFRATVSATAVFIAAAVILPHHAVFFTIISTVGATLSVLWFWMAKLLLFSASSDLFGKTIAVMSVQGDNRRVFDLWFCKNGEPWPPVTLGLGTSPIVIPFDRIPPPHMQTLRDIFPKALLIDDKTAAGLKQTLGKFGVDHPIDVAGHSEIPQISEFLSDVLLRKRQESA